MLRIAGYVLIVCGGIVAQSVVPKLSDATITTVIRDFNQMWEIVGLKKDITPFKQMISQNIHMCLCGNCAEGEEGVDWLLEGSLFEKITDVSTHMGEIQTIDGWFAHRTIIYFGNETTGVTMIANTFGNVNEEGKISEYHLACTDTDVKLHAATFVEKEEEEDSEGPTVPPSHRVEKGVKTTYSRLLATAGEGEWLRMAELFAEDGEIRIGPLHTSGGDSIKRNLPVFMRQLGFHPIPKSFTFKNFRSLPRRSFDYEFASVWIVSQTEACKAVIEGSVLVELNDQFEITRYTMVFSQKDAANQIEECWAEAKAIQAARELDVEKSDQDEDAREEYIKSEL
eukprot:CFRG5902T1